MTLPTAKKILLIEDDAKTARAACAGLESEGYATARSPTGGDGCYQLNVETLDAGKTEGSLKNSSDNLQ